MEQENPTKYNIATRVITELVFEFVPKRDFEGKKVLDLGCGLGFYAELLGPNVDYTGVDIDEKSVAFASKLYPHAKFFLSDIKKFETKEKFDYIIMSHVIEHFDGEASVLARYAPKLKKGGKIFIATGSDESILKPTMTCHRSGPEFHNKQYYTTPELVGIVESAGLKVESIRFALLFVPKIMLEIIKMYYEGKYKDYYSQADLLQTTKGNALFSLYRSIFPLTLLLIKMDLVLTRFFKGSEIVIVAGRA